MGIDAKETGAILWKLLGFSMNASIKFMRNHPILSGVSMFLLVLYIFLPSLLFFLIYTSPVLACAAVYARERLGLRFSGSRTRTCGGEKNGVKCHLKQQRSVRRNARMKVEKWDSQTNEEEKDKVILTSLYNDLLGRTPQFEDSPKAIETEESEKTIVNEDSRTPSCDLSNVNNEETMVCNCELDVNVKEETSNVDEYGISEIDRNKRLESLIARRRARRLFKLALSQRNKLQAEETTSSNNNNNLQVSVPRKKHRNYSSENIPGSAPSVLLKGRNPFDIPYDPQEERPNLTGDSFDEEFSLFNHQDMFFCRHESFCWFSLFSPQHAQCMNSPASASDMSNMRKRLDLDNEYIDHNDQKLICNEKEAAMGDDHISVENEKSEEREVEMNEETDSNKEEGDDSTSSEESESEFTRLNNTELREAICHSMDNYPGCVVNQARNSIPSQLPKATIAPRLDDNSMFYARRGANTHGRTFSIASDMQVEVSEIGSPPTTVDWLDDWSNGGESYTYDTDIDREIVRGEESRKRLADQYESRNETGSKQETKVDQKCVVDEHLGALDDTSLLDRNIQTKENVKQVAGDIFEQKPSNSSDMFKRSNSGKFGGLVFHTSVSLSSITEEPEIISDLTVGGNSKNLNYLTEESSHQRSLTSIDSSMKNFIHAEVVDMKANDDLCGSPKMIDHDNIQGEHDTEINVSKYENTKPTEYEAAQSILDASLDSSDREVEEKEEEREPNLGNSTEETENETFQSDLRSSPPTGLLESEVMEENGPNFGKNLDEKEEPIEQEKTQINLNGSLIHPHTQLLEDDVNVENGSDVRLIQVEKGDRLTLDNSVDKEISKEGENSGLIQDLSDILTEEHNDKTSSKEEPIEIQNSQDSQSWIQQCGTNSSEGISPRTLEATQQPEHENVIVPNTVFQDIDKDESTTLVEDSPGCNNDKEDNLKLNEHQNGEAIEKKLELDLKPMQHSSGFVAREDDESSTKSIEVMHIAAEAREDDKAPEG